MAVDVVMPDGTVIEGVPEGITQDELKRMLQGYDAPKLTDEWRRNTMRSMAGAKAKDSSWLKKAAMNIGAGAQELFTGAEQRLNDMFGNEQKGAELKRRVADERAVAEALAANTTGGGALQVAGNVLPTLAVPVGAFANTAIRAGTLLPRAYQALRAGRAMAPAAATTAKLGTAGLVGDAVLSGGVYGALRPTAEGESVLGNAAEGAAFSAALPAVGLGVNQIRRVTTAGGGRERAAEQIVRETAGEGADQATRQNVLSRTLGQLRGLGPQGPIPLTTAAQLDSADLARLERGSRTLNSGNWYDFDQSQARAVADEFGAATGEAGMLGPRKAARSNRWDSNFARADEASNMNKFGSDIKAFRGDLDEAMRLPEASNPQVRSMIQAIADDIDRVSASDVPYSPAHLQQIRANLSASFSPMNPNAFTAAPRSSPMRLQVMDQLDYILNRATDGKWQQVVDDYASGSRLVDQSKAAGRVRDSFYDRNTGRVLGVAADAAGDVPKITEAGLGRAINRGSDRAGNVQLSSAAQTRLNTVLDALRRQNITQRVARTATAGGGSNTASDRIAAEAAGQAADAIAGAAGAPGAAVARTGIDALRAFANTQRDRALAEALQNPQELRRMLEQLERSGQPLTAEQDALLRILRGSAVAGSQ
jgi:hypothetical protein